MENINKQMKQNTTAHTLRSEKAMSLKSTSIPLEMRATQQIQNLYEIEKHNNNHTPSKNETTLIQFVSAINRVWTTPSDKLIDYVKKEMVPIGKISKVVNVHPVNMNKDLITFLSEKLKK